VNGILQGLGKVFVAEGGTGCLWFLRFQQPEILLPEVNVVVRSTSLS
jgi:hypothetical protein